MEYLKLGKRLIRESEKSRKGLSGFSALENYTDGEAFMETENIRSGNIEGWVGGK